MSNNDNKLQRSLDAMINVLAKQAEMRDVDTGEHIVRTSKYVEILAKEVQEQSSLTDEEVEDIVKSAPLHDIGKVGVPDAILCKPGKLTDEEFDKMREHCEFGANVLKSTHVELGFNSFLNTTIALVASHHERWDGKGYPYNLKGDDIPLPARIMSVADVYDALRTERCYKKSFSHEKCVKIIVEERGKQFDPAIVLAFLKHQKEFEDISNQAAIEDGSYRLTGKVLFADDNKCNRMMLQRTLTEWGIECDTVDDGQGVIDKLMDDQKYDLIITDIHMIKVDGYEVIKFSKAIDKTVPVIAYTSSGWKAGDCKKIGCDEYLLKPALKEELFTTLSKYLKEVI